MALFTKFPATVRESDGRVTSPEVESIVKAPVVEAGFDPNVLVPAPLKVRFLKELVAIKFPDRVCGAELLIYVYSPKSMSLLLVRFPATERLDGVYTRPEVASTVKLVVEAMFWIVFTPESAKVR